MSRKNIQWKHIGTFANKSGTMDITDPCYDISEELSDPSLTSKWLPGLYNAYVDVRTIRKRCKGEDGKSVVRVRNYVCGLRIVHYAYGKTDAKDWICAYRPRLYDTDIYVDSGLCGFFDNKPNFKREIEAGLQTGDDRNPVTWQEVCDLVKEKDWAVLDYGVYSSSGFGNDSYNAYAWRDATGLTVAAELRFII
ncbi:MAG: hypothetical protein LBE09_04375 [Christensenellaceae bacterium]|nr:hypothetical protein [Christensenellaceae bacterium]